MRSSLFSSLCGALVALTPALAKPYIRQAAGSIKLLEGEASFTFEYQTTAPDPYNWIGVYTPGTGPQNGVPVSPSAAWDYAPDSEATLFIPTSNLSPGPYEVYFLAQDGYEAIGEPIEVVLSRQPGPLEFLVNELTLKNAREGSDFEANISGLLTGGSNLAITYSVNSITSGDWVEISPEGVLSGSPSTSGTTQVAILATASDDTTAELSVSIPVIPAGEPLVQDLSVLSYNLWHGGSQVSNYHAKQIAFLSSGNFDIVVLQESTGDHGNRLAKALGWDVSQGTRSSVSIISRYPIVEVYAEQGHGGAVRVALDGEESQVNVWGVHLGYTPYGPYDFCFDGMTIDQVLDREDDSKRGPQIRETVRLMKKQLRNADNIPVLLAGDFNAPSHLDWIDETSDSHCGVGYVPWPTSKVPTDAGMIDAFRVANPDPAAKPGVTWSPIFLNNQGRPEPLDRIDFVYYKGSFEVTSSEDLVVGKPKPEPNHGNNEWTSDHAAMVARFKL